MRKRAIIIGAAGRDFHNFNTYFRKNRNWDVACFTATQIPFIDKRHYPASLAGPLYPRGIPIYPELRLTELIRRFKAEYVFFSYSDVSHQYVMSVASRVMDAGANFALLGPRDTQITSRRPVIAVCAVRTGCGKSQTTRKIAEYLRRKGVRFAVIRHPMPYGNLARQAVQRFGSRADLIKGRCTVEEREEYEPYVNQGIPIFAGVDYEAILRLAEKEADIILWDGGNNDYSFYKPDLSIVVADPLRAGHEMTYYPSAINFLGADVIVVNKIDSATKAQIKTVLDNAKAVNPRARIILARSTVRVDSPELIRGKRVLVIEDGPTLTHGSMSFGAGIVAARKYGAKSIVDPRRYASGTIKKAYAKFTQLRNLIPALGYSDAQLRELQNLINRVPCDSVVIGTPIDLGKILRINKPSVRVYYDLDETKGDVLSHVRRLL
jgi:predicted GTPase